MKKCIAILLAGVMLFTLASCTGKKETTGKPSVTPSESPEPTENETPTPTPAESKDPTPEPTESEEPTNSFSPDPIPGTGLNDVWINTVVNRPEYYIVTLTLTGEEGAKTGNFELKCESLEFNTASAPQRAVGEFEKNHTATGSYSTAEDGTIALLSGETAVGSLLWDSNIILYTPADGEAECYIRQYTEGNPIEYSRYINAAWKVASTVRVDDLFEGFPITVKMKNTFTLFSDTRAQVVIEMDKEQVVKDGIAAVQRIYFDSAVKEDPTLTQEALEAKWLAEYGKTVSEWADEQFENYMADNGVLTGYTNISETALDVVIAGNAHYLFMTANGNLFIRDFPNSGADYIVTK